MSRPISICCVYRAARGDGKAFERLVVDMDCNIQRGGFTLCPCEHTPRCESPSEEVLNTLSAKVMAEIVQRRKLRPPR